MKRMSCLFAVVAVWLTATSSALAENHEAAKCFFKEAFFQQTVEGDVAKAIKLYQKGLEEKGLPAKLAAAAYYQLGVCYEKQNKKTLAKECYQEIVDRYPDEKANVAKAKKKLSVLYPKKRGGYIAYLDNLPVDRLDIKDPKVTRQYIKEKFGIPQFEHGSGSFINYGWKYGLLFEMDGDRVREICLFQSFLGKVESVDAKGKATSLPPLEEDLVSSDIELRKSEPKPYMAYLDSLPVDFLDIKDPEVTREYIKKKFGTPQYEDPQGRFLNYGEKYGLRFDMDGDRVREICLFKTFAGKVYSGFMGWPGMATGNLAKGNLVASSGSTSSHQQEELKKISPLQDDVKGRVYLVSGKGPLEITVVDEEGKPIPGVEVQAIHGMIGDFSPQVKKDLSRILGKKGKDKKDKEEKDQDSQTFVAVGTLTVSSGDEEKKDVDVKGYAGTGTIVISRSGEKKDKDAKENVGTGTIITSGSAKKKDKETKLSGGTYTVSIASGVGGQETNSKGRVFVPGNSKRWRLSMLECQCDHYAPKSINLHFVPGAPGYETTKKRMPKLPIQEGVEYKEGKIRIVLEKGASLRGNVYHVSSQDPEQKAPAGGYQVVLAPKEPMILNGAKEITVQNPKGEFFFDGIMEKGLSIAPFEIKPTVWELSCKGPYAPNSQWATKEFTFEKGEQVVAEILITYEPGKRRPEITIKRLPSEKTEGEK